MIAVIDYGVGNLFSLRSSLRAIGEEAVISREPDEIKRADRLILPGVGAFGDACEKLRETGMFGLLLEQAAAGKPLLGICLGMQLLLERSYEFGVHEGLGLIPGEVKPLEGAVREGLDIPHMGWNSLHFPKERKKSPLFAGVEEGTYVYFVHSYAGFGCGDALMAQTDYDIPVTAAVQSGNIYGTQFHPEKSGESGLAILKAFASA